MRNALLVASEDSGQDGATPQQEMGAEGEPIWTWASNQMNPTFKQTAFAERILQNTFVLS